MGKTYRIGEAAKLLELETYVLRFWETEFAQLVPLRTPKGQRAYTEANVTLLKTIKRLLYEQGLTIEGARRALAGVGTPEALVFSSGLATPAQEVFGKLSKAEADELSKVKIDVLSRAQGASSSQVAVTPVTPHSELLYSAILRQELVFVQTELQALQATLRQHNVILQSIQGPA